MLRVAIRGCAVGGRQQMRIFRREARGSKQVGPDHVAHQSDQRPSWMRNGAQVVLLDGDEDLEVVGESFYQENLWHLAGAQPGRERVREDIYAVLVAEDDNPYDPNAVAV